MLIHDLHIPRIAIVLPNSDTNPKYISKSIKIILNYLPNGEIEIITDNEALEIQNIIPNELSLKIRKRLIAREDIKTAIPSYEAIILCSRDILELADLHPGQKYIITNHKTHQKEALYLPYEDIEPVSTDDLTIEDEFLTKNDLRILYPEGYWSLQQEGYIRMLRSRIVICGLARDISPFIDRLKRRIAEIGKLFLDWRLIIYENDSTDDTSSLINAWTKEDARVTLLSDNYQTRRWPSEPIIERCRDMANYRNKYLDFLKQNYSEFDFLMVIDTDLTAGPSPSGLAHTFGQSDWDAVGSVGLMGGPGQWAHYDSWAYRHTKDWWPRDPGFSHWIPPIGSSMIRVNSCFGGAAVYKIQSILTATYDFYDCEHVCLHRSMISGINARIFLNPNMITIY